MRLSNFRIYTSSRMTSSLLGSHSTIHPESQLPSSEGPRYPNTEDIGSSSGPCNSHPVHYNEQALVILTLDFKIHAPMPREAERAVHTKACQNCNPMSKTLKTIAWKYIVYYEKSGMFRIQPP